MRLTLPLLTAAVLFLAAAPAQAEVTRQHHDDTGSAYEFGADLMDAATRANNGVILRIRPRAARVTLIRPRTQFFAELNKSVEHL